jgi:adenylate kinase family enzyme
LLDDSMMRVAILGNSGSGKSTLAGWLARELDLSTLDLDSVAWEPTQPTMQRPDTLAGAEIAAFCSRHPRWVVEGCYANLIERTFAYEPSLVFLNPGLEACLENCRRRPWEPHKYSSKSEQDAKLGFLLSWVAEYYTRDGPLSLRAHRQCFDAYRGRKVELRVLPLVDPPGADLRALLF